MDDYFLKWPLDFEGYSWEIESKGWFSGLEIHVNGRVIQPVFYDPVRLAQDMEAEMSGTSYFAASCLIVVPCLSREVMESAIAEMARKGELERLGS